MASYRSILSTDAPPAFAFIDPPFDFNSATVSKFPPEVTGSLVLRSLCRRLGWESLSGKRLLDFGCGVRFARTLVNLGMEIGTYAGVDVNADAIGWLQAHVADPRFRFHRLDMKNHLFNPDGGMVQADTLRHFGLTEFDAACMFSVITHQDPDDTRMILRMLRACVVTHGQLYFTAFIDESVDQYAEKYIEKRSAWCNYNPDYLVDLAREEGWAVQTLYPGSELHQPAFVCRRM